ncbi:MAG: FAD:protein FMN transferase [Acidobacteriota bacterium]
MSVKAADASLVRTEAVMGTLVTIQIVRGGQDADEAIERALEWFLEIEERCTRFDASSELMQLTAQSGTAVAVSPILFEAVRFALMVAEESGGAFDPTVGHRMAGLGFNREHRTGEIAPITATPAADVSYRDVVLNEKNQTILLRRPLTLDLGAVAKGLAVDTAVRELEPFEDFAIDAGGDLYLGGLNAKGEPWSVGIRHPRRDGELIDTLLVSGQAVCTSGDYERQTSAGHHLLDPRTGASTHAVASATVVAPAALLADALATAAFVLGPQEGIPFLTGLGVEGLIITPDMQRHETPDLKKLLRRA